MSTMISNISLNRINKKFDSELKNIFSMFFSGRVYDRLQIKRIKENVFLNEVETDVLCIGTPEIKEFLEENFYENIPYEEYISAPHNCVKDIKQVYESNFINYKKSIEIDDKRYDINISKNRIIFIDRDKGVIFVEIDFDVKEVNQFLVNEEGFVYIVYKNFNDEQYFIKTHLGLRFFKYNATHRCSTKIEEIECILHFKLEREVKRIIFDDDNGFNFVSNDTTINRLNYGRRYYFFKDDNVFFNRIDKEEFKDFNIVQVEHLHLYDWLSMLGLNGYKTNEGIKLSSKYMDRINNLMRFKFDDTKNGMLNYYDFFDDKDYKIYHFSKGIEIVGNFIYGDYEKGSYNLNIKVLDELLSGELKVCITLVKDNVCLKNVIFNTVDRILYFCNMKLNFVSYTYNKEVVNININVTDDYSVKVVRGFARVSKEIEFSDLSRILRTDQGIRNERVDKKQLVDVVFKDKFLVIKNYVKNSFTRIFENDLKIRFIEDDGHPSTTWVQTKSKDYYMSIELLNVKKVLRPTRTVRPLLTTKTDKFILKVKE